MTSKEYLASITGHPGILPDEIHTENYLKTRTRVKQAKHTIEEDLCEKRKVIIATIEHYKNSICSILHSNKRNSTKGDLIDSILEEKVIPELNTKHIFDSTCSHPYEQVLFRKDHILAHCPGDTARDALVKFFINRVYQLWRIEKNKKIIAVHIEHSDGQCDYHTQLYDQLDH